MADGNVVPFPSAHEKPDCSDVDLGIALGQAFSLVQLLKLAAEHGEIQIRTASDMLDECALGQALWCLEQQLRTARKAYGDFIDRLSRARAQEVQS